MLEILKFIFSSFWIWLGTVILIAVAVNGIGAFAYAAIRHSREK